MVSTMQSAVIGLTKDDAPSIAGVPAGSSRQNMASTQRYCAYIPPPAAAATVLPSSACAAGADPAATTVPAPSFPMGIEMPTRPAMRRITASGSGIVTTGLSDGPTIVALRTSALANRMPRSDGLIGAASTLMSTSVGPGVGTSTLASDSSTV